MTSRTLLVLGALGATALLPATALARHGADDPATHTRHAAHHHAVHRAHGDDARARARHRHHARHGADDGPLHAIRETHHGR